MNYKKLILVGFISAFVAILTSVLGVTGTIIGSVISSVLYNMLSEALENPVSKTSFNHDFEWEIAYIFPLVVIAFIQLLLIFALLSEAGFLPHTFVNVYLSIQDVANNNLYRILGLALLIMSAYPLVLKPEFVKKEHGLILVFVGLVFLARGFVDLNNFFTDIYDGVFIHFDLEIACVLLLLLVFVIARILYHANKPANELSASKRGRNDTSFNVDNVHKSRHYHSREDDFHHVNQKRQNIRVKNPKKTRKSANHKKSNVRFNNNVGEKKPSSGINKSSNNIHFESNDLLDEFKK